MARARSKHSCAWRLNSSALRITATPSLVAHQRQHSEGLCGSQSGQSKIQKRQRLPANEAVVNWLSRRDGDFPREPLRAPREANLAPQVIGDHLFYHARAEALVRGWRDGGAVRLGPTQHESAVCRARPLHLNVTIGYRQGPVLGGVGSQLM